METQPPADSSDCRAVIDQDGIGWVSNGYVLVGFNTTYELSNMTFYRKTQKVLTIDFSESYLNITEDDPQAPTEQERLGFIKIQWFNHTGSGDDWVTWDDDTGQIPDTEFAYRQQIIVRVVWQDDPETPTYIFFGIFTITRGMPWVQVEWQTTNLIGGTYNFEFVPCGIFYIPSNRTILSSTLGSWNETTGCNYGNSFAANTWFTVGFTTNGSATNNPSMENQTSIFLYDDTWERLDPLNYEAIIGHSSSANWTQDFSNVPYQYNYTFVLLNEDSVDSWHFAELWIPKNITWIGFYYSTDNGTTWENGIGYHWGNEETSGTTFQTTNGTAINATIYDIGVAGGSGASVHATPTAEYPANYNYSSLLGVYDRVAFGLELKGDLGQDWFDSLSAALVKAEVWFNGTARYFFDYDYSIFDSEPEQGYGLLNQTDGRLYFITANSANSQAWAIGMNQTLYRLRVTNYADMTLQNVLFSWNQLLEDGETGAFIMNVFGFLSIDTITTLQDDETLLDIFEFLGDNPRFQIHESFVKTTFSPLQTYSGVQRRYILNWAQTLTQTDWDSTGNYTIAMVEYNRTTNGWTPVTIVSWVHRRSSSPIVDTFESTDLSSVEFYLSTDSMGGLPPSPSPPKIIEPTEAPTTYASAWILLVAIIIFVIIVLYYLTQS